MSNVQTHTNVGHGIRGKVPKPFEKDVEVLRACQERVLYREPDAALGLCIRHLDDAPGISVHALLGVKMQVKQGGANILGKAYGL